MKIRTTLTTCFLIGIATIVGASGPVARSEKYRWDNVEIVGGGFVSGILYHPLERDLVYARTDIGGAYRWNPKTKRWVQLLDSLQLSDWNLYGVESIGLDPTNSKRLYLALGTYTNEWAGNGAIFRSKDQGRSFQRTNLPFKLGGNMDGRSVGERLSVDPRSPNVIYFGSRNNGLWRSEDFGATWAQQVRFPVTDQTDGTGICFEVFDPVVGQKGQPSPSIYVGVSGKAPNLYHSNDGGQTWKAVPKTPGMTPHHAVFDSQSNLVLTFSNGPGPNSVSKGAVSKFNPKTGEWSDITPKAGTGFGYAGLCLDLQHPGTMVVSTLDRWSQGDDVLLTSDWGAHWKGFKESAKMDSSASPFLNFGQASPRFGWWMGTVAIDPFNSQHVLFGTGATIWGTDDAENLATTIPTHWTARAQGLEETAAIDLISPPVGAHLFSGLGDIGGFRHDDLKVAPPEGMYSNPLLGNTDSLDFAELKPEIVVRVGRGDAKSPQGAASNDGGHTWKPFPVEPSVRRAGGHIAVTANGQSIVWTPERAKPLVSFDLGQTWTLSSGAPSNLKVYSDRTNPLKLYGFDGQTCSFFESIDAGKSFHEKNSGLLHGDVTVRPYGEGKIWLAAGKTAFHSVNGGQTFTPVSTITDVSTLGLGKSLTLGGDPTVFAIGKVAGREGAFRSTDNGASWVWISDAQHGFGTMDRIIGDPRIYGRVYIGTNGRGVLFGDPIKN